MKCEVTVPKFFLGTIQHGANAAHLYIESVGQFLVGQPRAAQNQQLRLNRFNRRQDGTHSTTFLFTQQVLERTANLALVSGSTGSFVLTASARSAQCVYS